MIDNIEVQNATCFAYTREARNSKQKHHLLICRLSVFPHRESTGRASDGDGDGDDNAVIHATHADPSREGI